MKCDKIRFTQHALRRMFERSIRPEDVRRVIEAGEVIEDYPDERPYPSALLLGNAGNRALHAVIAYDSTVGECYVVTVYVPDTSMWSDDYRRRR